MPTLKEKLKENLAKYRQEANTGDADHKLNSLRTGLMFAVVYQKMIGRFGEMADLDANLQSFLSFRQETEESEPFKKAIRELEDPGEILKLCEDPKPFMETLAVEEEKWKVRSALGSLAAKEDYKGMVDYAMKVVEEDKDPLTDLKADTVREYFRDICKQPLSIENAKTIKGFVKEFTERNAQYAMDGIRLSQEMEKDIRSGKYPETLLINDDPELPRKLGTQMMFNQTETGRMLGLCNSLNGLILRAAEDGTAAIDNDMLLDEYLDVKRADAVDQQFEKDFPEMHKATKAKAKLNYGDALRDLYTPAEAWKDIDGFVLRSGTVPAGESPFSKVPPEHAKYMNMPEELLLLAEQYTKDLNMREKAADQALRSLGSAVTPLLEEFRRSEPEMLDNGYELMRGELENFQRCGKEGFKLMGELGEEDGSVLKENKIDRNIADRALDRLTNAAERYAERDRVFAEKVKAFCWEQKQRFREALVAPESDVSLDLIGKIKKVRGMEEQTISPEKEYAVRMDHMPDKLKAARKKYDDAKLWLRGSDEYGEIGKAMDELEKRFKHMTKTEGEIIKSGKADKEESLRTMKANAEAVQEQLRILKEKTAAYYAHKASDGRGQWKKGTNSNADKRIEAVQGLDDLAADLAAVVSKQVSMTTGKLRHSLESRTPDYDTWCQMYPKSVDDLMQDGEPVPPGQEEFEKNVKNIAGLSTAHTLSSYFMDLNGNGELNEELGDLIMPFRRLLSPKAVLDHQNITKDQWNKDFNYYVPKLAEWMTKDDNFIKLMEAAERTDLATGDPPANTEMIVNSLRAMNKVFKTEIPVKALEKKYEFYKEKKAFREQAIDLYAKNAHEFKVNRHIQMHPELTQEQIENFRKENSYEPQKDLPQNKEFKEEVGNSQLFQDFMDSIKDADTLYQLKGMAAKKGGAELYKYINCEQFRPVDLDQRLADAKQRIEGARDPNGKDYPDKEQLRGDYAIIATVNLLKKAGNIDLKTIIGKEFDDAVEKVQQGKGFQDMMELRSNETLYTNAITGNGRALLLDMPAASQERKRMNANRQELDKDPLGPEMQGAKKK